MLTVQVCALFTRITSTQALIAHSIQLKDIYYIAFPKDHWRLKSVVSLSYALDVVQLIIATRDAYKCLATGWGDLNELDQVRLMWLSVPIFTAISTSIYSPDVVS